MHALEEKVEYLLATDRVIKDRQRIKEMTEEVKKLEWVEAVLLWTSIARANEHLNRDFYAGNAFKKVAKGLCILSGRVSLLSFNCNLRALQCYIGAIKQTRERILKTEGKEREGMQRNVEEILKDIGFAYMNLAEHAYLLKRIPKAREYVAEGLKVFEDLGLSRYSLPPWSREVYKRVIEHIA